jgi:hypothetical protein
MRGEEEMIHALSRICALPSIPLGVYIVALIAATPSSPRASPSTDAALRVIVNGPTRSAADSKTVVAEVINLGTEVCRTPLFLPKTPSA